MQNVVVNEEDWLSDSDSDGENDVNLDGENDVNLDVPKLKTYLDKFEGEEAGLLKDEDLFSEEMDKRVKFS